MKKTVQGFTLVELLIVIAIVAILAAVVVLIVNPLELTRRGRDATRLSDLANLQQAISAAVEEATGTGVLCNYSAAQGCGGDSVAGGSGGAANARASDGTGWVAVNLKDQTAISIPVLASDPTNTNTGTGNGYHYKYCADNRSGTEAWEVDAKLESVQQSGKMTTDGGAENGLYEAGSNLTLIGLLGSSQAIGTYTCTAY